MYKKIMRDCWPYKINAKKKKDWWKNKGTKLNEDKKNWKIIFWKKLNKIGKKRSKLKIVLIKLNNKNPKKLKKKDSHHLLKKKDKKSKKWCANFIEIDMLLFWRLCWIKKRKKKKMMKSVNKRKKKGNKK